VLLSPAQNALRKVVNGVGGFDHAQWRAFSNERTTNDAHGFIDGDLIEQARRLHLT
jgi:DNA damage-binding protein 1